MPKKKAINTDWTAWGTLAFSVLFAFSVNQNVGHLANGGSHDAPNSYALIVALILAAWNYSTAKRLRVLVLISLVIIATAGAIWLAGLHGIVG
jgi:glucan phosphoethanolaminetransferase (alkaline phosphatase superfamily)